MTGRVVLKLGKMGLPPPTKEEQDERWGRSARLRRKKTRWDR